ncbi:MAG: aspartate aminotransferase family protein [Actinobacteria bacterium]|nr:aspartate aminotransferase family protein [Actinomycetota bacterium]MBI3685924.1 aspartate aminotransferase family protein [Actinomycetota bacterium]
MRSGTTVDRHRLAELATRERDRFAAAHPRSAELFAQASTSMPGGVPMSWMSKWAGPFPVFVDTAQGAHFSCVDGHDYVDLCLGDTGAMAGHNPAATVRAVTEQLGRGITLMLPTEDAVAVGAELQRRFALPYWQFTLSATDANRHAIRYARHVTGRPKIAVFDHCYHGSVDESFATLDDAGHTVARRGNIGPPVPLDATTVVVPFNDLPALERALAAGDVACVLAEPAMTNIGIILPDPGYHAALRKLTRRHGSWLIIDETHTLCAGPGGYSRAHDLDPDVLVVGKAIGGGIPAAAFGMTHELTERVRRSVELEDIDVGGVGGTLAGNALSLAAIRATLTEVLTEEAFDRMLPLGARWANGVAAVIAAHDLPWHVSRLGCRAEYGFAAEPPRTGAEAAASDDFELQQFLHLYAHNRGLLLTPFHNMALMSPDTTADDVDAHTAMLADCVAELTG